MIIIDQAAYSTILKPASGKASRSSPTIVEETPFLARMLEANLALPPVLQFTYTFGSSETSLCRSEI